MAVSMIIHGSAKVGKTTLAHTAPGRRLVLDAEGGVYYTPGEKVNWDPLTEDIPDVSDDVLTIVDVQDWATFEAAVNRLLSDDHPFDSVILDSYTEIQKVLKDSLSGLDPDYKFGYDEWGKLLSRMEHITRMLERKKRPTVAQPFNLIIVCGTDDESGRARFLLQGALRKALGYWVDVIGYLHVQEDQQGVRHRVLRIDPDDAFEAGCRIPQWNETYGSYVVDPDLTDMIGELT